jgi:hypothetical protein
VSTQQTGAERILGALAGAGAQVVLIGGLAAVLHGVPHVTNDIDFCYAPSDENRARLVQALTSLHPRLRVSGLTDEDARQLPWHLDIRSLRATPVLTLETDAGALDLMPSVSGLGEYAQVAQMAVVLPVFGLQIPTLTLPALIASKRAAGRPKDLLALPHIEATLRLRDLEQTPEGSS